MLDLDVSPRSRGRNASVRSGMLLVWLYFGGVLSAAEMTGWDVGPRTWLVDVPRSNIVWAQYRHPESGRCSGRGKSPLHIRLHGICSPHGIAMFPEGAADYPLDGKYRSLRGAAFTQGLPNEFRCGAVCRISGDGKLLWESLPLWDDNASQPFLVDVSGVKVLRMQVTFGPGEHPSGTYYLPAGWYEPFLSTEAASAEDLAMFSADRFLLNPIIRKLVREAAAAFETRDFETVEKIAAKFDKEEPFRQVLPHPRNTLIEALLPTFADSDAVFQARITRLERYAEKFPESAIPQIAAARTHLIHAFKARGQGSAGTVTEEGWKAFQERIERSANAVAQPASKKHDYALRLASLLSAAACRGAPQEETTTLLDQAIEVDPSEANVFLMVGHWWDPRWGEAPGTLAEVARKLRQSLPKDQAGLACYFMAVSQWQYYKAQVFDASQLPAEDVLAGARLMLHNPRADIFHANLAAALACYAGDRELAREAFKIVDNGFFSPDVWGSHQYMVNWRNKTLGDEAEPVDDAPSMIALPERSAATERHFSADSKSLLTLTHFAIRQWDVATEQLVRQIDLPKATRFFLPVPGKTNEFILKTYYPIGESFLHRLVIGEDFPSESFLGPSAEFQWFGFAGDNQHFYGTFIRKICQWNLKDPGESTLREMPEYVECLLPGGDLFLIRQKGWLTFQLVDFQKNKDVGKQFTIPSAATSPAHLVLARLLEPGQLLAITTDRACTVELESGKVSERFQYDYRKTAAVSPDARLLAQSCWDGTIELRDLKDGKVAGELVGHLGEVFRLEFSPDGQWLASQASGGGIKIWPMADVLKKR